MVTGVLFLVTEVAAMAGLALYGPVLDGAAYVTGAGGADARVRAGALCEMVLLVAVIGTGVALYPVIRRRHEALAVGYVCGRLLEAAVIAVGIVSVLAVVTLRQDLAGGAATSEAASAAASALVAVHDWAFLLGPNVALGANTLVLAYVMRRTGLVPGWIALLGLAGGALICASAVAVLFGLYAQVSVPGTLAALPVFAWEVALAVRLLARGFQVTQKYPD